MIFRPDRLILVFVLAFLGGSSSAQDLETFTTNKSNGPLPRDFTELTSTKYLADYGQNASTGLDEAFFLETRYFIDRLLLSGRILFNEPISNYVNQVAKYVLKEETALLESLRFYVLKSNVTNAFSTDQGIIFVTTALLAHLENEAQLAFVLAHEVSHFTEKHVRDRYIESSVANQGTGQYERAGLEERVRKLSQYSKDHELEADKLGIEMYLKTEYAVDEIYGAFGALLYSYLPFDDRVVDTTFLNTPEMTVPGFYFGTEVNSITVEEDYDDEGSTHPNIKKRMDAAIDVLGDQISNGDKKFVVSEAGFNECRTLARCEEINLLLAERNYGRALYCIYATEKRLGVSRFLDLAKVKALYGLTVYENVGRYSEVTTAFNDSEGEISRLDFFLREVSNPQLNVIAYRHIYNASRKYPDEVFQEYERLMLNEMAVHSDLDAEDLEAYSFDGYLEVFNDTTGKFDIKDSIEKIDASDLSKYDKIKLKKQLRALEVDTEEIRDPNKDFHLFALADLVSEDGLKEKLLSKKHEGEKDFAATENETLNENGFSLGLEKVVIVDPLSVQYDVKNQIKYIESEQLKLKVAEVYMAEFKRISLERHLIDSKNLSVSGIDAYNDIGVLFQWVMEVLEHERLDILTSSNEQIKQLIEKYGTSHFLFTIINCTKGKMVFIPATYTELTAFSIDAKNDRIEFVYSDKANYKPKGKILDVYLFNILYQLDREPNKRR